MDGSQQQNNPPQNNQSMVAPQQHSNLIRTDQVQKLPHLNDQQKATHTQLVRNLWELLNNRDAQSQEYQTAHIKLTQLSQNLMKGMRMFQQSRQQALQQHQQAQAAAATVQGQPVQRSQSANPQSFQQLLPQIQTRVNNLNFFLPPNISQEQIQSWLPEARLRYGIALQKQEIGRARINELRQQFSQRQTTGSLSQEEMQEFKNRQMAAEKLFREGSDFLNKFREQQEGFRAQQQNQQANRPGVQNVAQGQAAHPVHPQPSEPQPAAGTPTTAGGENRPANAPGPVPSGQAPTPAPHTINSAVSAARQAGQAAMTPSNSQPGQAPPAAQAPPGTAAPAAAATPTAPSGPSPQQPPQTQAPQGNTGAPSMTYNQPPNNLNVSTTTPTAPQAMNPQAPPRPLSHQAAMTQAAQNYANTNNASNAANNMTQANLSQTPTSAQSQPQGYMQNRAENTTRNINMAIPKNLNVQPPEPVTMPPSRPTLSGGPSHGAMGMMGQPAIQKHPGYVLEGEGQRVLSKKMLDILVRQVTGGGEGEGLTPDAEEVTFSPPSPLLHLHDTRLN